MQVFGWVFDAAAGNLFIKLEILFFRGLMWFRDQGYKYWLGVFQIVPLFLFGSWHYILFAIIILSP
jgi:hypothetical protein